MILAIKSPTDVETAKLLYCAQYAHVGCGGAPELYERGLRCAACKKQFTFTAAWNLGEMIHYAAEFRSLVCN